MKTPTLRDEQAAQTRKRILASAATVFVEQGYAAARIEDIADQARVAVPTVYKVFTNKRTLLIGALNQAMTGGDDDGSMAQQAWFSEQLDEPDPPRQLQLIARNSRRVAECGARLLNVLRAAAPGDSVLADAWRDVAKQRLQRSRRTAKNLAAKASNDLRLGPNELTATLVSLTEPELFTSYTAAGRTADHYEAWLADLLQQVILHPRARTERSST